MEQPLQTVVVVFAVKFQSAAIRVNAVFIVSVIFQLDLFFSFKTFYPKSFYNFIFSND